MVIDHELDIAEDFAVSAVGFVASLGRSVDTLTLEDALGLRIENERNGEQALDPFCKLLAGCSPRRYRTSNWVVLTPRLAVSKTSPVKSGQVRRLSTPGRRSVTAKEQRTCL